MMRKKTAVRAAAVVIAVCVMASGCGPGTAVDETAYTEGAVAETVTEMAESSEELSLEDMQDDGTDASSDETADVEETDTGADEGTTAETGTTAAGTTAAETSIAVAETTAAQTTVVAGTDTGEETTAAEETTAVAEAAASVTVGSVAAEMAVRSGMVGRLVISSAGINVALISAPITDSSVSQTVVDGEDSAAYMVASATIYIADHYYQAFDTLKDVAVGDTAQIVTDTGVTELVCTSVQDAYNTGARLVDGSGNAISLGTYTAYTCLDSSGYPVRAVCFEPVS